MKEGDVFLKKQNIEIENPPEKFATDGDEMSGVLRQRTNRKILFVLRFNLWAYNLVSDERVESSRNLKAKRREKRNERRLAKDKSRLSEGWRTKWEWLKYTVGEPPVLLDTSLTEKSIQQLDIFLQKMGYFGDSISYSIVTSHDSTRATVNYTVKPGVAHHIRALKFDIRDENIKERTSFFESTTLIKPGSRFDVNKMDKERERITTYLNNRGYYSFTKDFIQFAVDSAVGPNQVDLSLRIRKVKKESPDTEAGYISVNHKKYFIGDVSIHTQYDPSVLDYQPKDTVRYREINVLYDEELKIKPELLFFTTFIKTGEEYHKSDVELTYRRFNELGVFRAVNIRFEEASTGAGPNILNCNIYLTPTKNQGLSAEVTGTHRDPSLGIAANLGYRHKNIFKGAEALQFKIHTGFEAQPPVTTSADAQGESGDQLSRQIILNTFEIGPELSLEFHRLFPIKLEKLSKSNKPSTIFSAAFNFQVRPDYERTLSQFRWRYRFQETKFKTHIIDPIEFSIIRINKSQAFEDRINELNDQFLLSSYQDHLISATGYTFIFNNQEFKFQRRHILNNASIEVAGNLMRLLHQQFNQTADENGNYSVFNIQFAQYTKIENDFRLYHNPDSRSSVVFRLDAGIGVPLNNLNVLPFDRSFFAGGSNGIRAWQARTLGPGSYRDSLAAVTFNNIGELKLEMNLEYRFDMTELLKGAFFVDAGNIWLLQEDEIRPGSGFEKDKFLSEIAVGAGFGLRFDFDFFLIRVDAGVQLKDPSKIPGERWFWEPKTDYKDYLERINPEKSNRYLPRTIFNLGIGYPF